MTASALVCGCIPPVGSGGWKPCPAGYLLLVAYYRAIEADPGNREAWGPRFEAYCAHIGQEAWA